MQKMFGVQFAQKLSLCENFHMQESAKRLNLKGAKELSLCHILKLPNPFVFAM